jgi:hypothetical protein
VTVFDEAVIDIAPEPQVLANAIDFYVENTQGDQAEARVEVSYASSPLSVRPKSPPEALVQQLQLLQQRIANEEVKCEGLQREVRGFCPVVVRLPASRALTFHLYSAATFEGSECQGDFGELCVV